MLIRIDDLTGYKIQAIDDTIGKIDYLLFDENVWGVRYLVVNVGNWLVREHVLLTPTAVTFINADEQLVGVNLTAQMVKNSPDIDIAKPVSREQEERLHDYYEWQPYWVSDPYLVPGAMPVPPRTVSDTVGGHKKAVPTPQTAVEDVPEVRSTLRSSKEVKGYYIHAADGEIGHVEDFIIDTQQWFIRYVIVDTRNWLPGKKVLVAPPWISDIKWVDSKVYVSMSQDNIKESPEYNEDTFLPRDYEEQLYRFYGQEPYWT